MSPWRAIVVLVLLGGCGGSPIEDTDLQVYFDTESASAGCASSLCQDFSMSCGATLLFQLTDGDSGEVLTNTSGETLRACVPLQPASDLCTLSDLEQNLRFYGVPPTSMRAEIALWSPEDVSVESCPHPVRYELFDLKGNPQSSYLPQPAFAGAQYIRAGESKEILIPLSCPNPAELSTSTCAANLPTEVNVTLSDVHGLREVAEEDARTMTVAVGEPEHRSDGSGGTETILENSSTFPLSFVEGEIPLFTGLAEKRFGSIVCVAVLEDTPQATSVLNCQRAAEGTRLDLVGHFLPKGPLDTITALVGPGAAESGLVIGRVVDNQLSAASGAVVDSPSGGGIEYVNADLTSIGGSATSSSGYFVSVDTEYPADFSATHPDGRRQVGSPKGGSVRGKVTSVLIRLSDEVIQP